MLVLVLVMMLCLGLALAIVLAVAAPARREGRDLLTPHGERVVARVKERSDSVTEATKGRTANLRFHLRAWRRPQAKGAADVGPHGSESPQSSGTASA